MKSTCSADVTFFPFDEQTCVLSYMSWGYTGSEVLLSSPDSAINTDFYTENGEWNLGDTATHCYMLNMFSFCDFKITIERIPTFFIINIILPIAFLSFLNVMVFLLPAESGEKVSYAITTLLSIALFMTLISDTMPKTSKHMSLMSYFLVGGLMLSALICVISF